MPAKTKGSRTTPYAHPVNDLQLSQLTVEWVPRENLRPNDYNPNRMTFQDRALLRQSILEDGWTQPIVTLLDGTIVDGEQRWTTAGGPISASDLDMIIAKMEERSTQGFVSSPSILGRLRTARERCAALEAGGLHPILADLTGGLVPITRVDFQDDAHKMIATIRHNRARSTHLLDAMAEIARDLQQLGLDFDDLETRLGMLPDEIERLTEIAPLQDIPLDTPLSPSWSPVPIASLTEEQLLADERAELARTRSVAANAEAKRHAQAVQHVEAQRTQALQAQVQALEAERGTALTQPEKAVLAERIAQDLPTPPPLPAPILHKFIFFVTPDEYRLCTAVLGDPPVQGFLRLCREAAQRTGQVPEGGDDPVD